MIEEVPETMAVARITMREATGGRGFFREARRREKPGEERKEARRRREVRRGIEERMRISKVIGASVVSSREERWKQPRERLEKAPKRTSKFPGWEKAELWEKVWRRGRLRASIAAPPSFLTKRLPGAAALEPARSSGESVQ